MQISLPRNEDLLKMMQHQVYYPLPPILPPPISFQPERAESEIVLTIWQVRLFLVELRLPGNRKDVPSARKLSTYQGAA